MLKEIRNVRQERGPGRRRWFESEGFELVVWEDATGASEGFQICYDVGRGEHALTWRPNGGFSHHAVDPGDQSPLSNEAPILVLDGAVPWAEIDRLFGERGGGVEIGLRELVRGRLAARR